MNTFISKGQGILFAIIVGATQVFARSNSVTQAIANPDRSKKSMVNGVATITGGTGKFLGIRGTIRESLIIDRKAGFNEGRLEGEYWLEN